MVLSRRLLLIVACLLFAPLARAQGVLPPVSSSASLTSTTCTGTPGTGSGCVALNVSGYASVAFQITGTFSATVTFEVSNDGVNYQTLNVTPTNGTTAVTTATATGVWVGSVGGLKYVRARVSAYTSGTAVVGVQAAVSGGGSSGGGGGAASSVTINDPSVTTQKAAVNASGQLSITCANCSGSGASAVDESAFTQGTNSVAPMGGLFKTSYTALTSGQVGIAQLTANGGVFMNLDKIQGTNADVNSGTKSAGTLRVVLATDQPQLTNLLKVTTDSTTSFVNVNPYTGQGATLQSAAVANGSGTALGGIDGRSSLTLVVNCASCAGGTTINFEISSDATNYAAVLAHQVGTNTLATTTTTAGITQWELPVGGFELFRARISAYSAGTVTITAWENTASYAAHVVNANVIGTVPVSGTFWQATQPVSGTFWQATQPVSGTVTANIGTTNGLALDASVTGLQVAQASTTSGQKGDLVLGATTTAAPTYTTAQSNPLSLTTAGALRTDASATTQPVSGTVTANAGTNLNTSALALDATIGRAQASTTSGQTGPLVQGAVTTAAPSYTTAQTSPLSLTTAGLLRTDGSGVTQPVSGTVTANAGSGTFNIQTNAAVNVAQINGVTPLMGAGATGTGAARVNTVSEVVTGAAPPAAATYVGGLQSGATGGFLGGITVCDLSKPINVSTATTTLMVTGVSGRQVRVCSFHMITALANNVAWLEGTGATCGTGTAGMAGGTTAASGYNFAANGGIAVGSGLGEVLTTATTGDSVCLITSAATQLSGFIKYTIF